MARKSKGIYKKQDIENIQKAVAAVKRKELSIRKASEKFKIAKSTLGDYVSGRSTEGKRPGREPMFPKQVEDRMAEKIMDAADKGFGLGKRHVLQKAVLVSKTFKIKYPFKNSMPSKDWYYGFRRRHPGISIRKPEKLSESRSKLMNGAVVGKYFKDLGTILDDLNIKNNPSRIWNMDEKNVRLEHTPTKVLARRGSRGVPGRTSNCRESVTVVATVNATGQVLPPSFIVKGKTPKSLWAWDTPKGPEGSYWTYQQNAWMKDFLGVQWFKQVFLPNIGPERPQLLLLDSHSSHEVTEMLEMARNENIHILAFPPHCTHHLQPLDKSVFGPLSTAYNKSCSDFMGNHPNSSVVKWTWPALFKQAWDEAVNKDNILSGFQACGIQPFNPNAVSDDAFKPSAPYERPEQVSTTHIVNQIESLGQHGSDQIIVENTSDPMWSSFINTPLDNDPKLSPVATPVSTSNGEVAMEISFDMATGIQIGNELNLLPDEFDLVPISESTTVDWNSDLNTIFEIPQANRSSSTKRKSLTSHRLLTSIEIINQKKEADEKKHMAEEKKLQNKLKREMKKAEKENKKLKIKEKCPKQTSFSVLCPKQIKI